MTGVPAIVLRIPFEGDLRIVFDALNEDEFERIRDWIEAHPRWSRGLRSS